jgi:hypothetical protein
MFAPGENAREPFSSKALDADAAVPGYVRDSSTCERLQLFGRKSDRWPLHTSW